MERHLKIFCNFLIHVVECHACVKATCFTLHYVALGFLAAIWWRPSASDTWDDQVHAKGPGTFLFLKSKNLNVYVFRLETENGA